MEIHERVVNLLFGFGNNINGQISVSGEEDLQKSPCLITDMSNIDINNVYCGSNRSSIITSNAGLYTCGQNDNYELARSGKRSAFGRVDCMEAFTLCEVASGYELLYNY
jgi:alpha-tubulin suppressor-like RCC1 family protein